MGLAHFRNAETLGRTNEKKKSQEGVQQDKNGGEKNAKMLGLSYFFFWYASGTPLKF